MDNEFQFRLKIEEGTQYKFRLFGFTIWVSNHFSDIGWFRLFGRGLKWKKETLGLTFSERNGYKKYLKINGWIISYLPKRD